MIVTNCSFITLIRENDIVISPTDMNLIIITVLAHASIRRADTETPLCLPGIAEDGFLYFTIKYVTPNIGVIFGSLSPDSFYDSLAKANLIGNDLKTLGFLHELTLEIKNNYVITRPIAPNGIFFFNINHYK